MFFLIFLILIQNPQPSLLDEAKNHAKNLKYEETIEVLKKIKPTKEQYNDYAFLMAISHFSLNQKDEAEKWIKNLTDSFEPLPERYKVLASLMKEDIQDWKNPVSDISRDMKIISNRLTNAQGGAKTQKYQQETIRKLDDLIKDIEDKMKEQQKQNEQKAKEQQQPVHEPMQDSFPGQNSGPGKIDEKKLKILQENWGKLPEKDRAKAMQNLFKDFPPQYREILEKYNKALSDINPKKPKD